MQPAWDVEETGVIVVVVIMTLATVAVAALFLAPRLDAPRVVQNAVPDRPVPFGFKMAWLAIRTRDTGRVLEELGLFEVKASNWQSGLGTVYDNSLGETHVFVSPPVNGWTFVVGLPLPHPVGRRFVDKSTPFLLGLGDAFVEVQYFFSYPAIDLYAWARVIDAKLIRAFAIGDEGVVLNKGRPTKEERAMGLRLFELRGVKGRKGDAGGEILLYPTENHVMQLAAKWSLDPTALHGAKAEPGHGYVGIVPSAWRPERLRKAA
jgi:hypothetical protein